MIEALYNFETKFGEVKFGELDKFYVDDFTSSFDEYFTREKPLKKVEIFDYQEFLQEFSRYYYY